MSSELERRRTRSARSPAGRQTAVPGGRRVGLWAVSALILTLGGQAAGADERPFGVVIAVGDIEDAITRFKGKFITIDYYNILFGHIGNTLLFREI